MAAAAASTLSILVGDVLLLWLIARVGVYFTERVEELESDPMLIRRVATGIRERGVCRAGDRDVVWSWDCVRCESCSDTAVGPLADRPWREVWWDVEGNGASPSVSSTVGIPKPGDDTSWPVSTSPNSCL